MALNRIPIKKGRPRLLLLLLAGVVIAMAGLSRCSYRNVDKNSFLHRLQKSGGDTIDVAIEISPLSYRMSGDTVTGLDYELLNAISAIGNRPLKFHVFARLDHAVAGMDSGYYDLIVSALPSTESLKAAFRLTDPVYLDREVLVQLHGSPDPVTVPEELGGDTVWIADGSPFRQRIENLSSEIGDTIVILSKPGYTAEHLIMLTAESQLPRAVVNEALAKKMQAELYPDLDISVPVSFTQFQCWIVNRNDDALADSLNVWIDHLKHTRQYKEILSRYGLN